MKILLTPIAILFFVSLHASDSTVLRSPDGKTTVTIHHTNSLKYSVSHNGKTAVLPSVIDMELANGKKLSADLRIKRSSIKSYDDILTSPVPEKRKLIRDQYNQLSIEFSQPYSLQVRAYNDGVAYRFITRFKDSITIKNERAEFRFERESTVLLPLIGKRDNADRFHTSFEENYVLKNIDSVGARDLSYSPVLAITGSLKIVVTESDLEDYPGMFLSGSSSDLLQGVFAPFPLKEEMTAGEFPQMIVTERAPYIARTAGTRSFPWRVLIMATDDRELPGNDLVYRLAAPSKITDPSWINPGRGTDEWIIGINLFNVRFKSGVNTATYKYYIDFASRFGLQRIMMDAGWSNYKDLFDINPDINMDTIAAYARSRNIRLSMWTLSSTLDRQLDSALKQFNKWGVDFIMTDFMDRDDQKMLNFYHRIAKAAANHRIMIMFHGAFPPKGFNRTWPNDVTREGVLGSEYNIWSNRADPEHDLILPFTRMLAGPMDYEPGLLDNATKEQFRPIGQKVMSQGTRCHQLAMFIVYDSPVQLFSGNPSQGSMEPEFMKLLGSIPTTWDETIILEAAVADYIITARRKGGDWYIGGMTDWTAREFNIKLDFLEDGMYEATSCVDGINAGTYPSDYLIQNFKINKGDSLPVKLEKGGGFLIKLVKK